ncbi:MFS transporter [Nocardioides nematodiphilus]|uniref:MFS transporter n=1 Tax=Nocardioides nematodiphilus TaxID=2849669 RepID=UPI001CDA4EF3|nr:MFS transporter [Nocardioides nematodiphilus]MCA1983755.1 MFS transporter [Nocardioides nematodiphilus]
MSALGDFAAVHRRRQQNAWNWYDWANSAFYTTVLTVILGPLMITVAGRAAGCGDSPDDTCSRTVDVIGLHLAAGSLPSYLTSFATIASAFVLPIVGAIVDRSGRKKQHMAWFAWSGAFVASLLFFLRGDHWQLPAVAVVVSSILGGCSLVSYYAMLNDISTEDERDGASSRAWAFGYLGGGVLLLINLVMVQLHGTFGLEKEMAARLSLLSAALWWAGFTIIPIVRLENVGPVNVVPETGGLLRRSFGQLWTTLKEVRTFPMTLPFLLAYLFYNDGIQTVIYSASIFGSKQLHFGDAVLIAAILLIQFVAFGGALFFGRWAERYGAYRCLLYGTYAWMVIVLAAMFLPARNVTLFLVVGIAIGVVLGGTQALSRSFYSLLIPRGREGEYFALYNACERGTSWFGTLLFGIVFQITGSYRPAIVSLVVFFVLGAFFLLRLDPRRGIEDAGNVVPSSL